MLITAGLQRVMKLLIKQPGSKEKTKLCKIITDKISTKIIRNTALTFGYGFGASQISSNIENMQNTPVPNIAPKPLSKEQMYTSPNHIGEILTSGLKGFGQGVLGGIEHGINTAFLGLYDVANDALFDGGYEHRQKELENLADTMNLGKAYKYANYAIDAGVDVLLGTSGIKEAKSLLNKIK